MNDISRIDRSEFEHHPLLARLLTLHQVPKEIFIQGALPSITIDEYGRSFPRILTVVGSRKCSAYGKSALTKLIEGLRGYPIIIVSGLALGIDGISHNEALKNNLLTLAVPGSGLSPKVLYPRAHKPLAQSILDKGGALISELPPETSPAQWTFPARNRIMAALSDAILVVEANEKSGTLITARLALELGKDIGALPGDITRDTSVGTNTLIKDGATPITDSIDIVRMLHLEELTQEKKSIELDITNDERTILSLLESPVTKDTLLSHSKLPLEDFLVAFSLLEIKGYIEEHYDEVHKLV